jgi:hypothetical protein
MVGSRIIDKVLLLVGIALLGWATLLSTRPDPLDQAPSLMAMHGKAVLEGRSSASQVTGPR